MCNIFFNIACFVKTIFQNEVMVSLRKMEQVDTIGEMKLLKQDMPRNLGPLPMMKLLVDE